MKNGQTLFKEPIRSKKWVLKNKIFRRDLVSSPLKLCSYAQNKALHPRVRLEDIMSYVNDLLCA